MNDSHVRLSTLGPETTTCPFSSVVEMTPSRRNLPRSYLYIWCSLTRPKAAPSTSDRSGSFSFSLSKRKAEMENI